MRQRQEGKGKSHIQHEHNNQSSRNEMTLSIQHKQGKSVDEQGDDQYHQEARTSLQKRRWQREHGIDTDKYDSQAGQFPLPHGLTLGKRRILRFLRGS